jgi:hypothetical protein
LFKFSQIQTNNLIRSTSFDLLSSPALIPSWHVIDRCTWYLCGNCQLFDWMHVPTTKWVVLLLLCPKMCNDHTPATTLRHPPCLWFIYPAHLLVFCALEIQRYGHQYQLSNDFKSSIIIKKIYMPTTMNSHQGRFIQSKKRSRSMLSWNVLYV